MLISKDILMKCCKYSYMSYHQPQIISRHITTSSYVIHKKRDAQVVIVKEDESTFIAFRGTNNISHLKDILMIMPHKEEKGCIHMGFYNHYRTVKDEIAELLTQDKNEHIYFTGHSMGGALALISAVMTKDLLQNLKKTNVVMFGSPCVGDQEFINHAENLIDNIVSIQIPTDIVSHFPLNPTFKKVSNVITLDQDPKDKNHLHVLKNHSCKTYYKLINNNLAP